MAENSTTAISVTILGLGTMGRALATAFLRKGCEVTVWNRTAGKATVLIAEGAREASTAAEATAANELVVLCVLDYAAADEIIEAAATALPGRCLVNLTNGTPVQARATAEKITEFGAVYLDGGIMAIPPMIGEEHAFVLYSGSGAAFNAHAATLEKLGAANWLGADAGLASLHDLALLGGMYGLFAGFLHAAALVESEGIAVEGFLTLLTPWLTAMMGSLPKLAEKVDSGEHTKEVVSNLAMQSVGLGNVLAASRQQGVATDLLDPMLALMEQRVVSGFGDDDLSGVFELIRRKNYQENVRRSHLSHVSPADSQER